LYQQCESHVGDTARIPRDEIVSLDRAADGAPIRERRISNERDRQL